MKTKKPIRLALLGMDSGFFTENFLLWTKLCQSYPWMHPPFPHVEITAGTTLGRSEKEISDNTGTSAQAIAKKYDLKLYKDMDELLEKEKPDGVFICGRPSALPDIALKAVDRGVHIYMQKPAGSNLSKLETLLIKAKKNKVAISSGQTWRHDAAVMATQKELKTVDMGKLCSLRVMYNHGMPDLKSWYFDPSEGGPELWLGWYPIDLLLHFAESKIVRLFATGHQGDGSGKKENTIIHAACEFANGVKGSLDFYGNISYPYSRAEWELLGEKGLIRNIQRHDIEIYQKGKPVQTTFRNQFSDIVAAEINAWLHSWESGKTNGLTLEGAIEVVRVALAIRKSFTTGQAVTL